MGKSRIYIRPIQKVSDLDAPVDDGNFSMKVVILLCV